MKRLIITRDIWAATTTAKHKGREVTFDHLDEARIFAKAKGYKGIKVEFHSSGNLLRIVRPDWKKLFIRHPEPVQNLSKGVLDLLKTIKKETPRGRKQNDRRSNRQTSGRVHRRR